MVQVYDVIPYLQDKLADTVKKTHRLTHPDVVNVSGQLDRFIVQEQKRMRCHSEFWPCIS